VRKAAKRLGEAASRREKQERKTGGESSQRAAERGQSNEKQARTGRSME